MLRAVTGLFLFISGLAPARAQVNSRAEEIQAERQKKAQALKPEVASKTEQRLVWVQENKILERLTYGIGGLRFKLGGLVTGSGFAVGPEFFRDDLRDGAIVTRLTAQGSGRRYYLLEGQFSMPKLANDHAFFDLLASQRNFPQMGYYGPGPDSKKTGRSNYRFEANEYQASGGVKPVKPMRLGVLGGYSRINVGPGTDRRFISSERIYGPAQAPGIDVQTDFLKGGVFAQWDYRDIPAGPRSGGNYVAALTYNKDQSLERHSFRRLDLEAQQYIPFFNQRRVIALRGKTALTYANAGQAVPFYLQPTLGGSDDLRGFRPFRFYDDNLVVFNAEYRYEVFAGMDMALFADAGKVFRKRSELNLHDLEGSYGLGMRFNARNAVFMRLDVGFSHEGFQVWVKFNNVF